jgi:hypothetical protein
VSDKQWGDIVAILRLGGATLDHVYMTAWAERLGITVLLERVRAASG